MFSDRCWFHSMTNQCRSTVRQGWYAALFFVYTALCFFTLEGLDFMNVFTDESREFGKYPIGIYKKMLLFSTFIIPYALIQYHPLLYILEKRSDKIYIFLPLIACFFFIPALMLWKFGVRHYQSSES